MKYQGLVKAAQNAKQYSYAPYSDFRVGAALLTRAGKLYSGCNIESSSFSLTICAERTALFKAVSGAERHFVAIAVATDSDDFVPPCGACRQVIHDLAGDIDVVLVNRRGKTRLHKSAALLPHPFQDKLLPKHKRNGTRHSS
ncbi:MAG TPA: cytidine deaminase [Bacteroidota bacterium]|nr:cytidine deaminase [Bacteroidota bacterium]